jgi:uncharacterized protein (UPF0332 family)
VIEPGGTFLDKAHESLEGARREYQGGRYSNSANRSYYAVFQAAIHAILAERIRPPREDDWDPGWVQGQFIGLLINRRHLYSTDLRQVLPDNYDVRVRADYTARAVTEVLSSRALQRAERFIAAIVQREGRS